MNTGGLCPPHTSSTALDNMFSISAVRLTQQVSHSHPLMLNTTGQKIHPAGKSNI